jgi:hypothetical protein
MRGRHAPPDLSCASSAPAPGRLTIGEGDAHAFPDCIRVFARERENVGQEGFNALVHAVSEAVRLWAPAVINFRPDLPVPRPWWAHPDGRTLIGLCAEVDEP